MDMTQLPKVSAPLPWHQNEWLQLHDQLEQGKVPHALLLAGEPDIGVAQLALALARLLLCSGPKDGMNCGECQSCRLSATGAHGDFLWVQPQEKSRTIKIDQVRHSVEFLNKTAGFGLRKVVVFSPADAMNTSAFNALLKSLEEPTQETYLILACHALHNVPATIRSRCQLRRLQLPRPEESLKWLQPLIGDDETTQSLLELSDGRPLLAQQLFLEDSAQGFAARRAGLQAVCSGSVSAAEAAQLWNAVEIPEMLDEFSAFIQRAIRSFSTSQLQGRLGREAFVLLDELGVLQRAVSAGSNPGRGIVVDALLAKFRRVLGSGHHGDTIARQ